MIGLATEEVSFCSCSSEAYNLLANALDLKQEHEVVITDLDFPAGATPWLNAATPPTVHLWKAQKGALLRSSTAEAPRYEADCARRASQLIDQIKGLLTEPGAQPFVEHVEVLQHEMAKFKAQTESAQPVEAAAAEDASVAAATLSSDVAFEDLEAEQQAEIDEAAGGCGVKRAAILKFHFKQSTKKTNKPGAT